MLLFAWFLFFAPSPEIKQDSYYQFFTPSQDDKCLFRFSANDQIFNSGLATLVYCNPQGQCQGERRPLRQLKVKEVKGTIKVNLITVLDRP